MRLHMKSILVAEDDPVLRRILEKTFIKYTENFEFVLVQDGHEAMDVLRTEPVDLVVTDIQMPRMNGLVLLAYINTYHPSIPCMIMTSYSTSRLKSKVPRGVLRFFEKPFKADDLAQAVVAALERDYPARTKDGISVVGFLDMIEMEQISCAFEVDSPDKPKGIMYFNNGILYDAVCGDLGGEAAAMAVIRRKISTYAIKELPEDQVHRKIKSSLQDIIRNTVIDEPEEELSLL